MVMARLKAEAVGYRRLVMQGKTKIETEPR